MMEKLVSTGTHPPDGSQSHGWAAESALSAPQAAGEHRGRAGAHTRARGAGQRRGRAAWSLRAAVRRWMWRRASLQPPPALRPIVSASLCPLAGGGSRWGRGEGREVESPPPSFQLWPIAAQLRWEPLLLAVSVQTMLRSGPAATLEETTAGFSLPAKVVASALLEGDKKQGSHKVGIREALV